MLLMSAWVEWWRVGRASRRRWLPGVIGALAVVFLLGCRVQHVVVDEPVHSSEVATVKTGSLPAGLYFRNGYLDGVVLEQGWPVPTQVVLLEHDVEDAMKAIPGAVLGAGYPLVVHTDELGLVNPQLEGIVLVLSLQESREKAEAWLTERGVDARIEALLDEEGYWQRLSMLDDSGSDELAGLPRFMVVQIDAGDPVPAFARDVVDAQMQELGRCEMEDLHDDPPWPVLCDVPGGAVFLMDVRTYNRGAWYHWAPVTCEGAEAYVSWRSTRLGSVIMPSGPDGYRMIQVGGAECDMPCYCEWVVDASARKEGPARCDCPPTCGGEGCS
jgi:hypothetical protein